VPHFPFLCVFFFRRSGAVVIGAGVFFFLRRMKGSVKRKRTGENVAYGATPPPPGSSSSDCKLREHKVKMFDIPQTQDFKHYLVGGKVGKGTYGDVFQARNKAKERGEENRVVALKKIKAHESQASTGFPKSALREVTLLRTLDHPSIVKLLGVVVNSAVEPPEVFLSFEFCDVDLGKFLKQHKRPFKEAHIKNIMLALCRGVAYLHNLHIMHRDLKMANILYTAKGEVKIADFGMARAMSKPAKPYTPKVITMWYRCPELLLEDREYDEAVDIWSLGCVFGELIQGEALLCGSTEIEQLTLILKFVGRPSSDDLNKRFKHLSYRKYEASAMQAFRAGSLEKTGLKKLLYNYRATNGTGELISYMLAFNPRNRISARAALSHFYFQSEAPEASRTDKMPKYKPKRI
jgi:cyclin-dependent kinase 10